ncbi:MAG: hypothetical protein JNJ48_01830 [Phycisphaerae bacterium]|nr:hypothetical protein [Phycisphaerae bacterium]
MLSGSIWCSVRSAVDNSIGSEGAPRAPIRGRSWDAISNHGAEIADRSRLEDRSVLVNNSRNVVLAGAALILAVSFACACMPTAFATHRATPQPAGVHQSMSGVQVASGAMNLLCGLRAFNVDPPKDGRADPDKSATIVKHENSPENLRAVFLKLHEAMAANDTKTVAAIARELRPTTDRLKRVLKDGVPRERIDQIEKWYNEFFPATTDDAKSAQVLAHHLKYSEVEVTGATTEEIIAYKEGSPAWREFPRGACQVAAELMAPGARFYEVEYLEKGKDMGVKFHMLFWDPGTGRWCMAGPLWRVRSSASGPSKK